MKNLRCIVYVSSATHELTTAHLEALLTDSRTYNHEHQVTGVLLHSGPNFMQCLEAHSEALDKVYKRLTSSHRKETVMPSARRRCRAARMFLVAFVSRSCPVPHSLQTHSLIRKPALSL